ncbi:MAG: hypothetical protein ACPG4K_05810, partial [Haloferula sp.]
NTEAIIGLTGGAEYDVYFVAEDGVQNLQATPVKVDLVTQTPYAVWSAGAGFDVDSNGDGIDNGIAFLLGAAGPNTDASGLLPAVGEDGGNLVMEFDCLAAAERGNAVLNLQYDGDLVAPWTSALVPDQIGNSTVGNVSFVVTAGPGSLLHVVATVDDDAEAVGGKLFGRLEGTE